MRAASFTAMRTAIQRPRTRSVAARQVSDAHERDLVTKIIKLVHAKITYIYAAP